MVARSAETVDVSAESATDDGEGGSDLELTIENVEALGKRKEL